MDFLAHFSTDENDDRHGNFTMLVSAPTKEESIDKFKNEILKTKKERDIFDGVKKIYLDVIIEINKVPPEAQITRYETRHADGLSSISINPVNDMNLEAFYWSGDEVKKLEEENEVYPFIEFNNEKSRKSMEI